MSEQEQEEERTYEVTVTIEHTESFDVEADSEEEAEETGAYYVKEDIAQGRIPVDGMDIDVSAKRVEL